MIIKVKPDIQKARALKKMAIITIQRLESTNLLEYPSNTLTDYYDIIHKLMEAVILAEGIKIKGEGAHKELIEYVVKNYGMDLATKQLLQQMRDYRNRISYEGFMINKNYILLNQNKIKDIIKVLINKLQE